MSNYGIRGTVFKWFENYFHNRKQYVTVNGAISSTGNIDCAPRINVRTPFISNIHRVQEKKGATGFFAVTFTNIDGFS